MFEKPEKPEESRRPRHIRMAGSTKHDPDRPVRIGRMMASPIPVHREYARRLLNHMDNEDRDRTLAAYRSVPSSIRNACEVEDTGADGYAARDEIDAREDAYRAARQREATGEAGALVDLTKSPHKLSEYMVRYVKKRGDKYRRVPLEPGENKRIHAEIMGDIAGGCYE